MNRRVFWHTDPDTLIADATQALEAKSELAAWLRCSWEYVDANLGAVLFDAIERLPGRHRRRRREDEQTLRWISRLVPEVPARDPYRRRIERALEERM